MTHSDAQPPEVSVLAGAASLCTPVEVTTCLGTAYALVQLDVATSTDVQLPRRWRSIHALAGGQRRRADGLAALVRRPRGDRHVCRWSDSGDADGFARRLQRLEWLWHLPASAGGT